MHPSAALIKHCSTSPVSTYNYYCLAKIQEQLKTVHQYIFIYHGNQSCAFPALAYKTQKSSCLEDNWMFPSYQISNTKADKKYVNLQNW